MNKLKVSVIVTTKNEEKNIGRVLKSITGQSYKNIEIIVVDHPQTSDKTAEIAKKYTKHFFIKGPERSAQRNYAVSKAKGKYVFILDADMILTKNVLKDAVEKFLRNKNIGAIIVPEKSFGTGFWVKFKIFEREFYVGDDSVEAARFFKKEVFQKFKGYDKNITGPEDFDLPLRMRKEGVKIERIKSYILHNEFSFSPIISAKKKFYYASKSGDYIKKHPEMVFKQGNLLFRSIFIKKWRKLIRYPYLSLGMFFVRTIEMSGAILGFLFRTKFRRV